MNMSAAKVNHVLSTIRGERRFPLWAADPGGHREELDALFERAGIAGHQWAGFVARYEADVEEGKRVVDFTVTYGFPPSTDARTVYLLELCLPYAIALKAGVAYAGPPDAALLNQLRGMMK
jgi:hypothetical protein